MKTACLLLLCAVFAIPTAALADTYQYSGTFTTAPDVFVFDTSGLILTDTTVTTISCTSGNGTYGDPILPCNSITIDPIDNTSGGIDTGTISFYENGVYVDGLDGRPSYLFTTVGSTSFGAYDFVTITDLSVTATPEPSSLLLLGTGVLGVAGTVRRRFRKG